MSFHLYLAHAAPLPVTPGAALPCMETPVNPNRAQLAAQPPPIPDTGDVWAEIIADTPETDPLRPLFVARREMGKAKYGTYLGRGNGRDFRADAAQEAVDGIAYCRGDRDRVGEWLFTVALRWVIGRGR